MTPTPAGEFCVYTMEAFKDCSHLEKEMILSNSNVMMRLQKMLQAQQEFADAISYELRNLRGAQERNHHGEMPEFATSKPKAAPKRRPKKTMEPAFELPQFSRKATRGSSVFYDD